MDKIGSKLIDELVLEAMRGDGHAFTALWDTYIDALRAYIRSRMKNLDDLYVDDICSRSFEKAFRQIGSFDPAKSCFFTWLRTIAKNTALDLIAQENRIHPRNQVVYLDDENASTSTMFTIPDQVDTPLESIIKSENKEWNEKLIEALPELYREVARRRLVDGMQYKEIALAMDLELNTVRTRLRRAKEMLDKMRKQQEEYDI